jgi:hypothetical protein
MEEVPLGDLVVVVEVEGAAEEALVGAGMEGRRGSIMLPAAVVIASYFQKEKGKERVL